MEKSKTLSKCHYFPVLEIGDDEDCLITGLLLC